jgi:hypothetical protein
VSGFVAAGGFAMPCAPAKPPEYRFARAAEINVDALTAKEAEEVDALVFRASADLPFGSAEATRLAELRAKANRPPQERNPA